MRFGPGVHFSASDVCVYVKERESEKGSMRERKTPPGFILSLEGAVTHFKLTGCGPVLNQQPKVCLLLIVYTDIKVISIHHQHNLPP